MAKGHGKDGHATQVASLNKQNVRMLRALVIGNVAACLVWIAGDHLLSLKVSDLKDVSAALGVVYPSLAVGLLTLASLATIAMTRLIPRHWQHRLVHLRWGYPLPACRAFTVHAGSDSRIEKADLEGVLGKLPSEPKAQNRLWYDLYLKHQAQSPHIAYHHRVYLLLMDSAMLVLVLLPVVAAILHLTQRLDSGGRLLVLMGVEFLVVRQAAHNAGVELVTDVLALESHAAPAAPAKRKAVRAVS